MKEKILIVYASQGGFTAGISEAIGKSLTGAGAQVDAQPVHEANDLSLYRAVVAGSAVHGGKWMPEMMGFVQRYRTILREMPVAVFQVCMMLATRNEQYRNMVPEWLEPVRMQIRPVAEASFAGGLIPGQYPRITDKLGLRIFLSAIKMQPGDYRDWDAIRAWGESLYPLLLI